MKLVYIMLLWAAILPANAHDTKIATFTLRDTGAGWLVEMNFAQAGVDAAMIEEYGKQRLEELDKKSYQNLVVDYVKSNFNLTIDGKDITLGSGGIMLGSHQTDLKFILPEIPLQPIEAQVHIPMFGNTPDHTNLFRVYRGGKNLKKFFLNEESDFKIHLIFTSQGVFKQNPKPKDDQLLILGSGSLFLASVMAIVLFSRKKLKA